VSGKDLASGLAPSCEFQPGVSGGISENVSKTKTSEESQFRELVTELVMILISRFSGAYEPKIT